MMKKSTIASAFALALFLLSSVAGVSAATGPGTPSLTFNLKATTHSNPAINSRVAAAAATSVSSGDVGSFGNATPQDGNIPGKPSQVDQGGANTPSGGSLNVPVVQGLDISGRSWDTNTANGLNAYNLWITHDKFNVEPPDQMLCTNGQYIFEGVNDNMQVFNRDLTPAGPVQTVEDFFQLNAIFNIPPGSHALYFSLSDPKCVFDSGSGHWFASMTFPFVSGFTLVFLAVSTTSSPLGQWNVYFFDTTNNGLDNGLGVTPNDPGCPCIADQPLLSTNGDAVFISVNEYSQSGPQFNGANMYVIDKAALVAGSPSVNVELLELGLGLPTPDGTCYVGTTNTGICWYSVQPAIASGNSEGQGWSGSGSWQRGQWDQGGGDGQGGVEYALSALQFGDAPYTFADNRIAVWAFTNTQSISSDSPNVGAQVTVIGSETYYFPITFAAQKAGPTPRGDLCKNAVSTAGNPCADGMTHPDLKLPGPIQPNDDRMNQVMYANGLLWGGLNTEVAVQSGHQFGQHEGQGTPSLHTGIAYFVVSPQMTHDGGLRARMESQGYIAAEGEDILFPSIGVTDRGTGVVAFTLTGNDYFPSAAYVTIDAHHTGDSVVIAAAGQSPSDGFTEFQNYGTPQFRPRWGDYSAAVSFGDKVYFATELIQHPSCSDSQFMSDPSCGGTRGRSANWGTSISVLST